jgi:copper resistance protein B
MRKRIRFRTLTLAALLASAAHAGLAAQAQEPPPAPPAQHDHAPAPQPPAQPDHDAPAADKPAQPSTGLPSYIPALTDEDRRAAFPDLEGHTVHDAAVHYLVLVDGVEWQAGGDGALSLDVQGWVGRDTNRLWFRADGHGAGGVDDASAQLLYGRQTSRWWDIVGGIRQDFRPGDPQTWAAIGIQGLAPHWFEIEATAFVGGSARTLFEVEVEYELLLTNRVILQPRFEADFAGKSDELRGIGAGLTATDLGFRLRYEWRREIAPYVGMTWGRAWGETADLAAQAGRAGSGGTRLMTGMRLWF